MKLASLCSVATFGVVFSMMTTTALAADSLPSREEMWRMIQAQQGQINELKQELHESRVETDARIAETDEKVEMTATALEDAGSGGLGADSGGPGWWQRTSLGGYGEMHYNGGDKDEIDFHRYVLFVNHDFNDNVRLFTELELEHSLAGEGKEGEVELEQAFVEFDLTEEHQARAGLFLLPIGILNETHEPPTFFGVERNPIESNIIPTTWWEGGVGFEGQLGQGFSYDVAVHSGLEVPTTGSDAFSIRSGRQKVSEASAEAPAVTSALSWTGYPGVEIGGSVQYQHDLTQNTIPERVEAWLMEAHTDIRQGPWGLRALYAHWLMDGALPEALGRDSQHGFYIEPSYRWDTQIGEWGVFARYNYWDNEEGGSADTAYEQYDIGLNYWPHPDVVLKADYAFIEGPTPADDDDRLNLGVGFQF